MSARSRIRRLGAALVLVLTLGGIAGLAAPAGAEPPPSFTTDATPLISGVSAQGNPLTVIAGVYSQQPDGFDYQWYADGTPVGTSSPIYRPSASDLDTAITVSVTAHLAGYDDVVTQSTATDPVVRVGPVVGWGSNFFGESTPPASLVGKTVVAVAAGHQHSLAVTGNGRVITWGDDGEGTLDVPASLTGKTVVAVAAGYNFSVALTDDGQVTAWGSDNLGQTDVPASLAGKTVVAISAGYEEALALTDDGEVVGWGSDDVGQTTIPDSLSGKTVVAISAGDYASSAITSDGQAVAWGRTAFDEAVVPDSLTGKTAVAVASGRAHSVALTDDGQVTTWGQGFAGQRDVPDSLAGKTAVAVAVAENHSVVLTDDGQLAAWGSNTYGESTIPDSLADQRVVAISAGGNNTLAITQKPPLAIAAPTITGGAKVGKTLTCASDDPDATFAWTTDGSDLGDGATYDVQVDDLGEVLTCTATVERDGETATNSADTAPVGEGVAGKYTVTVSGDAQVGNVLRAKVDDLPGDADVAWQWFRGHQKIAGAKSARYELGDDDYGVRVRAVATVSEPGYKDATAAGVSDRVDPADLELQVEPRRVQVGGSVTITVLHLIPGERWSLGFASGPWSIDGKAPRNSTTMTRKVRIPADLGFYGLRKLVITTSNPDRKAIDLVNVLR